jgi:anti-sigma regulatory factor (Ser/Thr protein kinase)
VNPPETRRFCARRSEFGAVRNFIDSACANLPHADRQRLVLIIEELFCNSIEHGYGGDSERPVWLALAPTAGGCALIYEDAARAHNPFAGAQDPPPDANAEDLSVGGLGVLLVGQFCTSKRYERRNEHNVIELFVSSDVPLSR